jgi:hypothetical protein
MRKHRQQMTLAESQAIESVVRSLNVKAIAAHAISRMREKGVSEQHIEATLRTGQAIEIHNDANELRILLRADVIGFWSACVVFSLDRQTVVTVWRNQVTDTHKTLRLNEYQWKVNVCELLGRV